MASTSPARCFGRAASSFGANAPRACLAPLKLILRGSTLFSAAATAITVRSRLYARRWTQISFSTIPGVLQRRMAIFMGDLLDRLSCYPDHLLSYRSAL